jgi:hypothetical protein
MDPSAVRADPQGDEGDHHNAQQDDELALLRR